MALPLFQLGSTPPGETNLEDHLVTEWNDDMEAAPSLKRVEIKTANGYQFFARLVDGFVGENDEEASAWVAEVDDAAPDCWTEGVCWKSNENFEESDPPVAWRYPPKEQDTWAL